MIPIKTPKEIKVMREGGRRLSLILSGVLSKAEPGTKLKELESLANSLIKKSGGRPSFKMVKGYRWATCLNVNQGVVHGVPNDYQLKEGDLLRVDVGLFYQGFHTDMARTIRVRSEAFCQGCGQSELKSRKNEASKFLEVGEKALEKAIEAARSGNRVGHISAVIEKEIKKAGCRPIESLTGHGVGCQLHQEPAIPCLLKTKVSDTPLLKPGMVLAIEVIYSQGRPDIVVSDDKWTVETADGSPAGLFEKTMLISRKGPRVITEYLPVV